MNPLGAITALNDLKNLKNRNKLFAEKIKFIHHKLSDLESLYFPKISNYQNIGGFHYGIPFFVTRNNIKKTTK